MAKSTGDLEYYTRDKYFMKEINHIFKHIENCIKFENTKFKIFGYGRKPNKYILHGEEFEDVIIVNEFSNSTDKYVIIDENYYLIFKKTRVMIEIELISIGNKHKKSPPVKYKQDIEEFLEENNINIKYYENIVKKYLSFPEENQLMSS